MPENAKTDKELLLDEIKGLITDSTKDGVKKEELESKLKSINDKLEVINKKPDNHEEVKALKNKVEEMVAENAKLAGEVRALKETPAKVVIEAPLSKKDQIKNALIEAVRNAAKDIPNLLTERDENGEKKYSLKEYFTKLGNKQTPAFVAKIAVDMLESNIVGNYVNNIRMTELDPNRVGTPLTIFPHVVDWMPVKGIGKKFMSLLVVGTYVDGSGTKTEGSAPSQSSFLLTTVEFVSAVIGTYFNLSDETLEDLPEAMEEIAIVAPSKLKDNIDSQILGSAGNDTTTIKGLYAASKHTDFASATTYATTIPNANKVDVIAMMKHQAEANKYPANTLIVNPLDLYEIAAEKDQMDNSKVDRRVSFDALGNPVAICGLIIRKNTAQTANTITVLDANQVQIGDRRQMSLEVGYDGNDFKEGQKTVRVSVRLAFGVRDALAVIYCDDLDAAVTAISVV